MLLLAIRRQASFASRKADFFPGIDVEWTISAARKNTSPDHISAIIQPIVKLLQSKVEASYFDMNHEFFNFDYFNSMGEIAQCTIQSFMADEANGDATVEIFNFGMTEV